jgi:hypothetical protein
MASVDGSGSTRIAVMGGCRSVPGRAPKFGAVAWITRTPVDCDSKSTVQRFGSSHRTRSRPSIVPVSSEEKSITIESSEVQGQSGDSKNAIRWIRPPPKSGASTRASVPRNPFPS